MDLKQLRYFAAVLDEGGMRKAATALHVSQPALTVAVQNLEESLGVKLFVRTGRTIEPSREGYQFYQHARAILAQAEKAKSEMRALGLLEQASLPIAATGLIANHVLAAPLSDFLATNPGVKLSLRQLAGQSVESALKVGEIEVGFTTHRLDETFEQIPLFTQQAVACLLADHPAANAASISWKTLLDMPLATLPKSYLIHEKLIREAARHRKSVNVVLETDVMSLLASAIEAGTATGLLIEAAKPKSDRVMALPIAENKGYHFTVSACWRRDMPLSVAGRALIDFLKCQQGVAEG